MKTPIQLLYLEDDDLDRESFLRMVGEKRLPYEIVSAETLAEARTRLAESHFDVIVADYHLPDGDCTELFSEVPETPFVLITGTLEEQLALRTLERGADDYLPKDPQQRHLEAVPFTVEKTLHRKRIRDSEQQLARQVRQREEQLRLITDNTPALIAYIDTGMRYQFVNHQYEVWFGTPREAIVGKTVAEVLGEMVATRLRPRMERALAGEAVHYEDEISFREGGTRWVEGHYVPHRDEQGQVLGFYVLVQDISARKQAEADLRTTEERFRAFMENNPAIAWAKDAEGRHVYLNRAFQSQFGVRLEDWRGKTDFELWPEEMARQFRENDLKVLMRDQPSQVIEETADKTGEHRYWLNVKFPFQDAAGRSYIGGIGIDLTEQKRVEEKLRQSEQRLRATFDQTAMGIMEADTHFRFIAVNDRACEILGFSREELLGKAVRELTHPEDRPRSDQLNADLRAGRRQQIDYEKRYLKRDGTPIWVHVTVSAVRNDQGRLLHFIGTIEDISTRKAAEQKLQAEKAFSEAAINSLPGLFYLFDEQNRMHRWNHNMETLTGYSAEEIQHMQALDFLAPEDRPATAEAIRQVLTTGEAAVEAHFLTKDGRRIPFACNGKQIRFGSHTGVIGMGVDISQRVEAEQALRESELFYRQTLDSIPGMVFTTRPDGYCDYQSRQWVEFTGVPMSEHLGDGWNQLLHPEDRERAYAAWRAAVEGRADYDLEYRVRRHDGAYRWFKVRGRPIRNARGQIVRWFGVALNIEDLKQAEAALQRQNQRLQILQQATADLLTGREPTTMLSDMHERIVQNCGADSFMLYLTNGNGDLRNMHLQACAGTSPEEEQRLAQLRFGRAVCVTPEEALQPIVATHIQSVEAPGRRFLRKLGFQAYLYYPLILGDRVLGTLAFASRQREDYDTADQAFFQTIARTLAEAFERTRLEAEVKRHTTQLEKLVQERTAKLQEMVNELEHFSYTITHDMRAPLRAMRGFGGILLSECGDCMNPLRRDLLRRIGDAAERMDHLITDALKYSQAVQTKPQLKPVDAVPLLRGIVESYPQLQPPHAEVLIEEPMPRVLGNEAAMIQCFSNLLDNAVKFVEPGKNPQVRVWAECPMQHTEGRGQNEVNAECRVENARVREGFIRIWFEDNGIGINPEFHDRIFVMFQRLSKSYEGTGIGLALVRKVVQRMGGQVGVESEPGQGSRFWVEFRRGD